WPPCPWRVRSDQERKGVEPDAGCAPDPAPALDLPTGLPTGDSDGAVPGTVCAVRGRLAERRRVTSGPVEDQLEWLCQVAVAVTEVSCCGVTMMTQGGQSVTAHASDERARAVEDLQHTLGEGPGVAASASGAAVLVP